MHQTTEVRQNGNVMGEIWQEGNVWISYRLGVHETHDTQWDATQWVIGQ